MNERFKLSPGSVAAGVEVVVGSTTSAATSAPTTRARGPRLVATPASNKSIENAVYAHLQAMRALGHTTVNTGDVARALGLSQSTVEKTIAGLASKGVKAI